MSSRYLPEQPAQCHLCKAEVASTIKHGEDVKGVTFTCGVVYSKTTKGEWCRMAACRTKLERPKPE